MQKLAMIVFSGLVLIAFASPALARTRRGVRLSCPQGRGQGASLGHPPGVRSPRKKGPLSKYEGSWDEEEEEDFHTPSN
jgi:hypothetical protein